MLVLVREFVSSVFSARSLYCTNTVFVPRSCVRVAVLVGVKLMSSNPPKLPTKPSSAIFTVSQPATLLESRAPVTSMAAALVSTQSKTKITSRAKVRRFVESLVDVVPIMSKLPLTLASTVSMITSLASVMSALVAGSGTISIEPPEPLLSGSPLFLTKSRNSNENLVTPFVSLASTTSSASKVSVPVKPKVTSVSPPAFP